jgi:site-specific DNA recombinase
LNLNLNSHTLHSTGYKNGVVKINGEMEDLRSNRSVVMQAKIVRRETLVKVREIDKVIWGRDGVRKFDEKLFVMLVEQVRVMNWLQVEFVLQSGIRVIEIF